MKKQPEPIDWDAVAAEAAAQLRQLGANPDKADPGAHLGMTHRGGEKVTADAEPQEAPPQERVDLALWERKALNRVKQGRSPAADFESEYIRAEVAESVELGLKAAESASEVREVFREVRRRADLETEQARYLAADDDDPDA